MTEESAPHVLPLTAPAARDVAVAGGKAANLAVLAAAGLPVPDGFVVTVAAFEAQLEQAGVGAAIGGLASGPSGAHERARVRRAIAETALPGVVADAIEAAADDGDGPWAVRSSATTEDTPGASYAGQHATYYFVPIDVLARMVAHCWASLYDDRACAYRETRGVGHADARMAVIVQRMVRAEASGVTFTADPVTGSRETLVTEATWGLGAALVDGRVTPDRYVVARADGAERERYVADKRVMIPAVPPAPGAPRLADVPARQRLRPVLGRESLAAVTTLALAAESAFGAPQDVEWALEQGEVRLLQSRPITPRARPEAPPPGRYVLFKPVAENFTEPLTPLSESLYASFAAPGYVFHRGRLYMALSEIRRLLPLRADDATLAQLAWLGAPDPAAGPLRLSLPRLALFALGAVAFWIQFGVFLGRTRALPDDALEPFRARAAAVRADASLDAREALWSLCGLDARFLAPIGELPIAVNLGATRYFAWLGLLKRLLARWAPELPADTSAILTAGTPGMKSADMGRELRALAARARAVPAVAAVVRNEAPEDVPAALCRTPGAGAFLRAFDAFLEAHGHRAAGEFELAVPRWREDPAPVIVMVRNYLDAGGTVPAAEAAALARRRTREAALADALGRLPGERATGLRGRLVAYCAKRVRYFTKLRENTRYYHIMTNEVVRTKLLALERRLLERGALSCAGDAFYLRYTELEALAGGALAPGAAEALVRARRVAWTRECAARPPRTLGIDLDTPEHADGVELRGFGASPGRCEGQARVVRDPGADATLAPGEILVAPYTDPAWTPLFLTARAAVVEVGSYLSHAGTVAREYGMPCVVDVADCTRRIADGDRIAVDGDSGVVTLLGERGSE